MQMYMYMHAAHGVHLDNDKGVIEEVEFGRCLHGGETTRVGVGQGKLLAGEYQSSTFVPERSLDCVYVVYMYV